MKTSVGRSSSGSLVADIYTSDMREHNNDEALTTTTAMTDKETDMHLSEKNYCLALAVKMIIRAGMFSLPIAASTVY